MSTPCPIPEALAAKWSARTVAIPGGHLAWTGPPYIVWHNRQLAPRLIAFILHTSRAPAGRVQAECGHHPCVEPAHVEDPPGRYRIRLAYRAVRGMAPLDPQCARGHDQTRYGRLEPDGTSYCAGCARPGPELPDRRLRLHGTARLIAAQALKARYDAGASIRDLMASTGRTYGYVHDLLALVGTDFRPRGFDRQFHQR